MIRDIAYGENGFLRHWRGWLAAILGAYYVLIHVYAGFYGPPEAVLFRSFHVALAMALVFLYFPLFRHATGWLKALGTVIDVVFILGALWTAAYFVIELETWDFRRFDLRFQEYFTAIVLTFLVLEGVRRAVGQVLVWICVLFIVHALFADHFPGMFYGPPASASRLIESFLLGSEGIYGIPVAVMAQFVVLFILFAQLLNITGGGTFFTRLAFALFGHRTGGPAKAAVVSSALMGTVSGSAIGNVMTTGVFTIPLMRHLGYRRDFAGGVEAAASNGGIIMPPVMGAVAFIMAEFLDRPYVEIILAAAIPAILYYAVIFVTVDLEARKLRLQTMNRADLPRAWPIVRRQGYLALPLILIVVALLMGYSIVFVAVVINVTTFLIALIQRTNRMTPVRFADAIEQTARATAGLSVTAASAGIIIGSIFATGLSFAVSQAVVDFSDGQTWLLLVIAGLMALIMGTGMGAAAVYITLVATVIPILTRAGIPEMSAHFFAFYYGIISNITPPVALAAFAAAPIAGAGPMATSWQASRLGAATFLLPVLFVYAPALLLEGTWYQTVVVSVTSGLSLVALAIALTGYLFTTVPVWLRVVFLAASGFLIVPEPITDGIGLVLLVAACAFNWRSSRRPAPVLTVARRDEEDRVAAASAPTLWDRALRRILASRIEREGEAEIARAAANQRDIKGLTRELMEDREGPGNAREVSPVGFYFAWAVVVAIAVGYEVMGQVVFHATHPILWLVVLFAFSALGMVAIATLWRRCARPAVSETAQAAPARA